ncbi:cupin domain-containing protein [Streptomyces sp. NPDC090106]|uniref:cupin domain-containing protein n=1 Tax=Streptomyces sp. NPDC090106 TaxID=3365946 RepID=UPI003829746B
MGDLIVLPGQGRKLVTKAQEVTFKAGEAQGSDVSIFEVVVPPGFDTGAHFHEQSQEFFYILEGELELLAFEPTERTGDDWLGWESVDGERVVRAGAGSSMFVPPDTPHAFRNATDEPVRMLFQCYPSPEHEHYFEEIAEIWSTGRAVDAEAVQRMRSRYDVKQITPMRFAPPSEQSSGAAVDS